MLDMTPQFHGRKSDVMVKVPKQVARCAASAFRLRALGFRGGTNTGWKRAAQLSSQDEISIHDLRFIRNWYARHVFASYPGYRAWEEAGEPLTADWHAKNSILSWLIWGGDPGLAWVNSSKVIQLLNVYFGKQYSRVQGP